MKRKKKKTPEQRAAEKARFDETTRMLEERIAHYEAKLEKREKT